MTQARVEVVVVGAGLAGACVVRALVGAGVRAVGWLARTDTPPTTPPVALVHPFAGRSFQPRPGLDQAWEASCAWAQTLGPQARVHWAAVRRYPTPSDRERLFASMDKHGPSLREAFGDGAPRVVAGDPEPHILYDAAYAIDLGGAVASMRGAAATAGIEVREASVESLEADGKHWLVQADAGCWSADHVVIAAGAGSLACLPATMDATQFERVEGVLLHAPAAPLRSFAISGGHACSTADQTGWGSSYALPLGRTGPGHEAQLVELDRRLRARVPLPGFEQASRWSGERFVDRRTRRPRVETLAPGLHACTAFGSQGGLLAPAAALEIVALIQNGRRRVAGTC